MKRVYCLYRVLTKKQVDRNSKNENDIPMQKTACRDFASSKQKFLKTLSSLLPNTRIYVSVLFIRLSVSW